MLVAILVEDAVKAIVHSPALAASREVVPVPDNGPGALRLLVGVVGAGVAHHKDIHELVRVVLGKNRPHEVANDRLLVVRRDEEGIPVQLLCRRQLDRAARRHADEIDKLVEVRQREEEPHDHVEDHDGRESDLVELHTSSLSHGRAQQETIMRRVLHAKLRADALPGLGPSH